MLESIPGEIIAKAAAILPDAKSAPDEPHNVVIGPLDDELRFTTLSGLTHRP
jgi:hypothetical protein